MTNPHTHLDNDGRFQSDTHPELPPDKIVLSFKDPLARAALYKLAERYQRADPLFARDIRRRLRSIQREELGCAYLPEPKKGGD
jgi:hypothetical protein